MKKALSIILVLAMMLASFAMIIPVNAEEAAAPAKPEANKLAGQETIYVLNEDKAPKFDGKVEDGEYTTCYTIDTSKLSADISASVGYVKLYITNAKDNVYVAVVVQEANHVVGSNSVALRLGFGSGTDSNAIQNRFESTLRIDADRFFAGTSIITGESNAKGWGPLNTVMGGEAGNNAAINKDTAKARYYARGKDADGKDITTYEVTYTKSVIETYFPDADYSQAYVTMWINSKNAEGGTAAAEWKLTLDDATKEAFKTAYGYAPTLAGHYIKFFDAPKANEIAGQQKIYVLNEDKAPTFDGKVEDGEYTTVYTIDTSKLSADISAAVGYAKLYITNAKDNVYVAVVVQENEHTVGKNSVALRLGFGSGTDSNAIQNRFESTLRIDADRFFAGTSIITGEGNAKGWGPLNTVMGGEAGNNAAINKDTAKARYYARGKDADGKDITTYEVTYTKSVIETYFPDADYSQAYVTMWINSSAHAEWKATLDAEAQAQFKAAYGYAPSNVGHYIKFFDAPNTYEVPQIGQETIVVDGKANAAPKADGVIGDGEYTSMTTFTAENIKQMYNAGFTTNAIGYVKLGISYDDDAVYFAIVVQENDANYKYGRNNVTLQVLADDDGDAISALKQFESTIRMDGSADAPTFFIGTSNYEITNEATGATNKLWTYLGTVHGEGNNRTPANAKYRWFTRAKDADGKDVTVYEFKYTMADMKKFFGEDNDFSRISIKMNVWAYDEAGATTGRWTYWNATTDIANELKAAYGVAPGTIGHVVEFKEATPDTSDNSVKYVVVGAFALLAVVALGTTVVYKKRRQLSK